MWLFCFAREAALHIYTGDDGGNGAKVRTCRSYLLRCGFRPESARPS